MSLSDDKAIVSRGPIYHGDGYAYGGNWMVTFDELLTVDFGCDGTAQRTAEKVARLYNESQETDE